MLILVKIVKIISMTCCSSEDPSTENIYEEINEAKVVEQAASNSGGDKAGSGGSGESVKSIFQRAKVNKSYYF